MSPGRMSPGRDRNGLTLTGSVPRGTTLANPAPLTRAIPPAALALRGAFHPTEADQVPAFPDGTAAGTLLLLGWTGGAQWPAFAASPEYHDGQPDPLDRWTRRHLAHAAAQLDAQALHPGEGPPYLPFQRWAIRAENLAPSPLGLLIHPAWGLWHAWRGALALRERLDLAETPAAAIPCAGCPRPCLTACPVSAFTPAAYDATACATHLGTDHQTCLTTGCAARLACPVYPPVPYSPDQLRFHMAALSIGLARAAD